MHVRYETIAPPPQLADFVRFFWVFEINGIGAQPYVYRSMADGCAELVFHYRGPFAEVTADATLPPVLATLHAQSARPRRFVTHEDFGILGAFLYPYALPRLFGFTAASMSNEMPQLTDFLGRSGRILEEQIITAPTESARLRILSDFLTTRLAQGKAGHPTAIQAIRQQLQHDGQIPVTRLAGDHGISPRQLERHFRDYAGFSPKAYARILRFQSAIQRYGDRHVSLTQLALECGYFDQAHFVHDFQQFSGYNPREYFKGKPEGIEYRTP